MATLYKILTLYVGLISAKLSNNPQYENTKEDFTDEMKSSFSQLTVYLDQL